MRKFIVPFESTTIRSASDGRINTILEIPTIAVDGEIVQAVESYLTDAWGLDQSDLDQVFAIIDRLAVGRILTNHLVEYVPPRRTRHEQVPDDFRDEYNEACFDEE